MYCYQSNRLEVLADHLTLLLADNPPLPGKKEIIVVQHHGMAQWLSQQIAEKTGIAANLDFPLPARFLGKMSTFFVDDLADNNLLDQAVLLWRVFEVLPNFCKDNPTSEPALYLNDDQSQLKRYHLAASISSVFDSYTVYRPDLINSWDEGKKPEWQAELWRQATENRQHKTKQTLHFLDALKTCSTRPGELPSRCFLFGLGSIPPASLDILMQLSIFTELHFFHLSPCGEYWGDILTEKQKAKQKKSSQGLNKDLYLDIGNPLLSSWGTLGKEFQQILLEYDPDIQEHYLPHEEPGLLAMLQNHILHLENGTWQDKEPEPFAPDPSLQFHICHSPLREVQVLHNRLLDFFDEDPELTAGDILITAPDIHLYAEAIHGVFTASAERYIPYSITDRPLHRETSTIQGFLRLLNLLSSRCTAPEVLALLETPAIQNKFSIEAASMPQLLYWVEDIVTRWGLDTEHRRAFSNAEFAENSWQAGLDRLFLGYFMGDTASSFESISPCSKTTGADELLGALAHFIRQLNIWQKELRSLHSAEQWCRHLLQILNVFFEQSVDEYGYSKINETLVQLAGDTDHAQLEESLAWETIHAHLQACLQQTPPGQPFLSGKVSCCNMVPMRTVPFKIICLLGMQEAAFPRQQQSASFDLIAQSPRPGDRDRRKDDRYLFLESLLSARKAFYLSWIGRNQRSNDIIPPSVVVSELRDYIDRCFPDQKASRQLTREHPLQAFSPKAFTQKPWCESYSQEWLPARELQPARPFFTNPLPCNLSDSVELAHLSRFWTHPARYFLEKQIGIQAREKRYTALEEAEPFHLDHLDRFLLRSEIITTQSRENSTDEQLWQRLKNTGNLPQGGFGALSQKAAYEESRPILQRIKQLAQRPIEAQEVDLHIGPYHLFGWLDNLYENGRVTWRSGKSKGNVLLELWINHLILQLVHPESTALFSYHINTEEILVLAQVDSPEKHLSILLDYFMEGQLRPIYFFPETSWAWACAAEDKKSVKARYQWTSSFMHRGEGDDPAHARLFGQEDELPFNEEFRLLSGIYSSINTCLKNNEAA